MPVDSTNQEAEIEEKPTAKPKTEQKKNPVIDVYTGTTERTIQESSYHPESLYKPYNPDKLYQKTGDYSIFEEMVNDDQVSVCLRLKKDLVIGAGWEISCSEEDHEEIKEDIEVAIGEDTDYSFDDMLEEIISAYEFGFSLSEKIFKHRDDGSLSLRAVKTRHPNTWLIHTDKHGNVKRYEQRGDATSIDIDKNALIHYVVNRKFQNPYGTSDLLPAYAAYFTKRQVVKYYAIFLEKSASPTPVARYDKNAPQQAVDDIYAAIKKFQAKTALAIPKDIEIEFLEAKSNGEAYNTAINLFNMFIGRSLFVPDLVGLQGSATGGGSYTLGKEQIAIFAKHINRRRKSLEDLINREIIWPIVSYNWGYVDDYPKFRFKPISNDDAIEGAKIWLEAVKGKVYEPNDEEINYFRSLVKFPEGEIIKPEISAAPLGQEEDSKINIDEPEEDQPSGQGSPKKKPSGKDMRDSKQNIPGDRDGDGIANESELKNKSFALNRSINKFEKKVNFQANSNMLDNSLENVMADIKPIINLIVEDIGDQIRKKRIIQTGNVEKIDTIKVPKLRDVRLVLQRNFKDLYKQAKSLAMQEIYRADFASTPLTSEEFNTVLEQELYNYIGDWEYKISQRTRLEIINALKDGRPISSVISSLGDEITSDAATSIERYSRTKHTEVMNRARLDAFDESGVVAGYMFSAIMDGRTSEICAGLDGKVFSSGTQPVPPLHFNALVEGELICTARGDIKIEDIKVGDLVVTHHDQFKPVYDVMSKFEDKEFLIIELENGKTIKITGEHPVYCGRGWIRADELMLEDDVICFEDITNAVAV